MVSNLAYLCFISRLGLLCFVLTMMSRETNAQDPQKILFNFDAPGDAKQWGSVNDDVMGGRSAGDFRVKRKGILEFSGNLSLENRGGFASVRSKPSEIDLAATDVLVIRLRGDGRSYYCNLYVPTDRIAFSHRAEFETESGRWSEVRLPLSGFRATWFGRTLPEAPEIDAKSIRSLGFLIADKKPGPFKLEVDWIGVADDEDSSR